MSEKYYRDINTNKDIIKFKLQLGSILLKLNENNLNISKINDILEDHEEKINEKNNNYISIDKKYNVKNQSFNYSRSVHFYKIFETEIEDSFKIDMMIEFSNDIYYEYANINKDKHRLEHEYQFYYDNNLFYKILIKTLDGIIDLNDNSIIMKN